jgi:hypothetical protein
MRGLPQDSRYQTILRDTVELPDEPSGAEPSFGPWSLTNYQLANLTDAVNALSASLAGAERPDPMPRPMVKRLARAAEAEAISFLQSIRDRHRREAEAEAS